MQSPIRSRLSAAYASTPSILTHRRNVDTVGFNMATIELPWEDDVLPGPVNEYLEVIDIDPVSDQFYEPVDLNNAYLLAQDGLPPSEGILASTSKWCSRSP